MKRISFVIAMIAMLSIGVNAQEGQLFEQKSVKKVEVSTTDFEKAVEEKMENRKEVLEDADFQVAPAKKAETTKEVTKPDTEVEPKQSSSSKGSCAGKGEYASSKKGKACCASKKGKACCDSHKAKAACGSSKKSASTESKTTEVAQ